LTKDIEKAQKQLEEVEALLNELNAEEEEKLGVIVKAADFGTIETLHATVSNILDANGNNNFDMVKSEVGPISRSDIDLASAMKGIIVSMDSKPSEDIKKYAKESSVDILNFNIIYKLIEELETLNEKCNKIANQIVVLGTASVEKIFEIKVNESSKECSLDLNV
jgi:translation initiation factor IF-2